MILKSRQIGATWYFAREALLMRCAMSEIPVPAQPDISVCIPPSGAPVQGIHSEGAEEVDVELKGGDKIVLSNGAELHFLGTSAATAVIYGQPEV
jgi:uncharacterized protein YjcR